VATSESYPELALTLRASVDCYVLFQLLISRKALAMHTALFCLNLLVSLISAAAGVIALVRPERLSGSSHVEPGEIYYACLFAARTVPIGLFAGILPFTAAGPIAAWVIFTAAVIQIGDVLIALRKKDTRMTIGASFAAAVYLVCGFAIK
jgi:hypothetical protein